MIENLISRLIALFILQAKLQSADEVCNYPFEHLK